MVLDVKFIFSWFDSLFFRLWQQWIYLHHQYNPQHLSFTPKTFPIRLAHSQSAILFALPNHHILICLSVSISESPELLLDRSNFDKIIYIRKVTLSAVSPFAFFRSHSRVPLTELNCVLRWLFVRLKAMDLTESCSKCRIMIHLRKKKWERIKKEGETILGRITRTTVKLGCWRR